MKYTALGSQVFAGGFAIGVAKHFDIPVFKEWDDYGGETLARNWDVPILKPHADWHTHQSPVDFVFGNPPCSAWSSLNYKTADWRNSPHLARHMAHAELARIHDATAWATESVPSAFTRGREFFLSMADDFMNDGYKVTFVLHDAKYLGLPQNRPRLFVVASKVEIPWQIPDPETTRVPDAAALVRAVKVDDHDVITCRSHHQFLSKHYDELQPGEKMRALFDRLYPDPPRKANGHVKGRPSFCEYRLPLTGPARTMAGSYTVIHPDLPRPLALPEFKALCGYPRNYKFVMGGDVEPNKIMLLCQLARAVMPPVGEWLARQVHAGLDANIDAEPGLALVDFRSELIHLDPWNVDQPDDPQLQLGYPGSAEPTHPDSVPQSI